MRTACGSAPIGCCQTASYSMFLRADAAVRVPRQIQQRRKLLLRQVQVGLSDARASAQQIHLQRAKPYCAFLRVRRTQTRFHAGHEHLQSYGFVR